MAIRTISTLADLSEIGDGLLDRLFQRSMQQIVEDLIDRPTVETARRFELKVSLVPVAESGVLSDVRVEFEVTTKAPSQRTRAYSMSASKSGALRFNDLSPDDVKQRTLDQEE